MIKTGKQMDGTCGPFEQNPNEIYVTGHSPKTVRRVVSINLVTEENLLMHIIGLSGLRPDTELNNYPVSR
jgi:hypothetical protein